MGVWLQFGRGELGWVFGYSLGGEEEGEIEEESIGRVGIYWRLSMESPTERFRRYTRRWVCHVTVWRSWFESLGYFIGKIVLKKSTSSHRYNFSKKLYNPSAIRSVFIDECISSVYTVRIANGNYLFVYTDRSRDEIISVGNFYRQKNSIGNSVGFRWFSGSGH
jgi:hypothetical protein